MRDKKSMWMSILLVVTIIIGASVGGVYAYKHYIVKDDVKPVIIDQTFDDIVNTTVTDAVKNRLLSFIDANYYRGQIVKEDSLDETIKLQMAIRYLFNYSTVKKYIPTCDEINALDSLIDQESKISEDAICNQLGNTAYVNQDDYKAMKLQFYKVKKSDVTSAYYDIYRILTNQVHQTIKVDEYVCEYNETEYLCYSQEQSEPMQKVIHNVYKFEKNAYALVMYEQVLFKDNFGYNTDYKFANQVIDTSSIESLRAEKGFKTDSELESYLLSKYGVVFQHLYLKNSQNEYYWYGTVKYDETKSVSPTVNQKNEA